MSSVPVFTVIMDTFYRPILLKEAVDALLRQTFENLEIILVNNGATLETREYLWEVDSRDRRVKLVHFEENQYSADDPTKMLDVCLNAALEVATGDYVWYQCDDNLIADDYAEKMVILFEDNPECTTAAGLPVEIDENGNLLTKGVRISNYRPRYMPGHLLALGVTRGEKRIFSAPGTIFTIKRDVLIRSGGYHRAIETSHLYGIVPFGVTGFDETALFYWRRHKGQLNKQLSASGFTGIQEVHSLLNEWEIEHRWRVFGRSAAILVAAKIWQGACRAAAACFVVNLFHFRPRASLRVFGKMWHTPLFWKFAFSEAYTQTRQRSLDVLSYYKRKLTNTLS